METARLLFNCPHCARAMQYPAAYAGAAIKCVACGKPLTLPQPAVGPSELMFGADDAEPLRDPAKSEPWFYRFLEAYAIITVVITILFQTLFFAACMVLVYSQSRQPKPFGQPSGFDWYLAMEFFGLVFGYVIAVVGTLFSASLVLLFVDIGRTNRAIARIRRS